MARGSRGFIARIRKSVERALDSARNFLESAVSRIAPGAELFGALDRRAANREVRSAVRAAQPDTGGSFTDEQFARELANARVKGRPSALDSDEYMADAKARIFFAATRPVWQGAPASQRYDLIKQELGVGTLQEAYEEVMRRNGKALVQARRNMRKGGFSYVEGRYGESAAYDADRDTERRGSPDTIAAYTTLES